MTDQTQQLTSDFQQSFKIQDSEPTTHRNNVPEEEEEEEEVEQQHEQEQEPVAFEHEEEEDDDDDDEEEKEFSFSCSNPHGSPISPSSAFREGQIRPMFPLFDTSLLLTGEPGPASSIPSSSSSPTSLKKLFSGDRVEAVEVVTVSEACKKSHSTGHSKVWKFRDLMTTLNRSNSDGKDAFVFLKNGHSSNETERGKSEEVAEKKNKTSKTKTASSSSAHERLYVKNRERKEEQKRKSYLPYRQGLVGLGFFTNVSHGLSRNMHPY